jgi:hypothetical protein
MDTIIPSHKKKSLTLLNKLFENLSYFDEYGTSVMFVVIATVLAFIANSYLMTVSQFASIKNNWAVQRCNPSVIPFAGLINKPENKTATEYTKENFTYCVQDILTNISSSALQPLSFLTNGLQNLFGGMSDDLQNGRDMFSKIRANIAGVVKEIMGRLLNVTVPIQQIVIAFKDTIAKVVGIMTAGLMTLLGSYFTLKSLLGSIMELIIIILVALAALVVSLWLFPFTWGVASAMTATFIAISIPLAIIAVFMKDVLHIHTKMIPKVPSMKKCFDEDTLFLMNDKSTKKIKDICVGDMLYNGNAVTTTIKLCASNTQMYILHKIVVSGTHTVYHNNNWILVKNHPDATIIKTYSKPFIYSLNVLLKKFSLGKTIFADWDELYDHKLTEIKNKIKPLKYCNDIMSTITISENEKHINYEDIHVYLNGGFPGHTPIKLANGSFVVIADIKIGDILDGNSLVYGKVEINGKNIHQYFNYLGKGIIFEGCGNIIFEDPENFPKSLIYTKDASIKRLTYTTHSKLYHILTYPNSFYLNGLKVYDYNSLVDYI